jgi:2-keto-4-pentenoate hydratase/2-oxohepta-3-ene-1,7-dioic acid hydratase in catechol pathway
MKLARTPLGLGVVDGEAFAPLDADLLDVLAATPEERERIPRGTPVALADIELLAPIQPASIRDGVTFEEHVEGIAGEVVPEWYDAPTFYFTNVHAVTGPHDDIPVPPGSKGFDFELEVAAVIGRAGRDLTPEAARDHIAAYTVFNDWSARDIQFREMNVRLGPCKARTRRTRSAHGS